MTRIKDIAEMANVSTATVSRILNNDPLLSVSSETRQRVLNIVSELNYQPGRKKKTKSIKSERYSIGLVITNDEAVDPYFMSIRQGIEKVCQDYSFHISSIFHLRKTHLSVEDMAELDGLIVLGDVNMKELQEVYKGNNHIVYVDFFPEGEKCDVVLSDFETATSEIVNYLFNGGHRQIAYIGGKGSIWSIHNGKRMDKEDVRKKTFEKVMKEKGIYKEENVLLGEFGPSSGYALMEKLIKKGPLPSAVVIASDPMAIGAMKALQENGINVPEDISIFSFDDIDAAAFLNPALSTVKVHTEEMGKSAVKLLYDRIKTGRDIPLKVILPTELVIRDSTKSKF
ncbi:LacI family DNA-binding transcriptional regulator [Niallia sp. 01092]|uniref:LacI family DNA-binding transcriptional regulator n=1 Tax=unclassified Niallia TaxID=2837522 RepID=UPI003FD07AE7